MNNENETKRKPAREFTSWRETKNPRFSPTTYNLVADVLADALARDDRSASDALFFVAQKLATKFEADNPKFDQARFLKACGYAVEGPSDKSQAETVKKWQRTLGAPQFPKKGGV